MFVNKMASRMTKGFIAIFVIIIGLLVVNFSINVDLSKVVNFALATGVIKKQSGNLTNGSVTDEKCGKISQIEECKDCLKHQLENYPECKGTGKRQNNRCSKSKAEFYTSCRTNEERKFWIFQITALVLGLLSSSIVWCRSKHLDEHVLGKIRKQISGDS